MLRSACDPVGAGWVPGELECLHEEESQRGGGSEPRRTTLGPARGGEQRGIGRPSLLGPRADGGLRGRGRRVLGGPFSGARRAAPAQTPREAREASSSLTSRWPETPRVPQRLNLPPQIQGHGPETTLAASLNLGVGGRGAHARPTFVAGHGQPRSDPDASPPLPSPARRLRAERAGADAALLRDAWGGS